MAEYDDQLLVGDALEKYFSNYHFKDGGYADKWFKIKLGFLYLPLPNVKWRVEAVRIHDLHHIVTEYRADLRGEAEIGGWEIASGCGRHAIAWILNSGSFFYGLIFYPSHLWKAFMNGKRIRHNFYRLNTFDESLLQMKVGDLRKAVLATPKKNVTILNVLHFIVWAAFVCTLAFLFFYCLIGTLFNLLHLISV